MTTLEMPDRLTAVEARKELNKWFKRAKSSAGRSKKPSKYKNKKTTTADGIEHASAKQGMRWVRLCQDQRDGKIRNLEREKTFRLEVNGHLVCKYIADHVYEVFGSELPGLWTKVVEDVKSPITRKKRDYRIKFKLMQAIHDITIQEV